MTETCPECNGPMASGSMYCRRCAPKKNAETRRLLNEMAEAERRTQVNRGAPPPKTADQVLQDLLSACRAVERNANRLRERMTELKTLRGMRAVHASVASHQLQWHVEHMLFALQELREGVPYRKGVDHHQFPMEERRQRKAFEKWQKAREQDPTPALPSPKETDHD
jgi:hypothetical protein